MISYLLFQVSHYTQKCIVHNGKLLTLHYNILTLDNFKPPIVTKATYVNYVTPTT